MEEQIIICSKCSYKSCRSQLYKTKGVCPRRDCGNISSQSVKADTTPPTN